MTAPALVPPDAVAAEAEILLRPASPSAWRMDDRRRFVLLVVAAVVVGFALRTAIGLTDEAASTDETAYLRSGLSLIEGDGFERDGRPELHFPPFVPFLLGLTSKVFDDPHTGTVWLTIVSGTALIVPLALLGRRLAGATAGAIAAWVAALTPGLSTMLPIRGAGSEAEYTLLLVTAVWLTVAAADHRGRARLLRLGGAGLGVGLAYLTRPEGLFAALPLGLVVLGLALREATAWRARLRSALTMGAALAAPLVACIVPYAMYLHDHTGEWQLTAKTQDASIEAWHAVARADREARDQVLYALDDAGLAFSAERSSLPSLARRDPVGYLRIFGTNVGSLVTTLGAPEPGQVLAWMLLPPPVLLVAAAGAWRFRRSGLARLLLVVAALPVATGLMFFVQPRYLVVTIALATVFVGAALAALPLRWRRPVLAGVVILLALSTVQAFRGPAGWWHPREHTDQRGVAEWIATHTDPDDRIMTRSMIVEYYAERPTVALPYADLDEILEFARHYGAQYLVADSYTVSRLRPQLQPLREHDRLPGLRLVYAYRSEGRTTRVFALDPAPPPSSEPAPALGFMGDG